MAKSVKELQGTLEALHTKGEATRDDLIEAFKLNDALIKPFDRLKRATFIEEFHELEDEAGWLQNEAEDTLEAYLLDRWNDVEDESDSAIEARNVLMTAHDLKLEYRAIAAELNDKQINVIYTFKTNA